MPQPVRAIFSVRVKDFPTAGELRAGLLYEVLYAPSANTRMWKNSARKLAFNGKNAAQPRMDTNAHESRRVMAVVPASAPVSTRQWRGLHLAILASPTADSCPFVFIRGFFLHRSGLGVRVAAGFLE